MRVIVARLVIVGTFQFAKPNQLPTLQTALFSLFEIVLNGLRLFYHLFNRFP